ncbi:hypothetical protein AVEN_31172-1 [Araneus ventricosus]|uniref:Uncharacterized protein n=1 Tax=Araneus ventricosus TaxID=182803 RepID=A0A4Y2L9W8_ARAVE|nr:hypothetical protein AVEN_31172-1 [Araneus ventricosus]
MSVMLNLTSINLARGTGARCFLGVLGGPLSPPIPFGPKPYGWAESARVFSCSSHRRRNIWRTLSKIQGVVLILSASTTILATRASAESAGISYNKDFMCLQKKKSSGLGFGERGGQATGPPRPTIVWDMWHSRSAGQC